MLQPKIKRKMNIYKHITRGKARSELVLYGIIFLIFAAFALSYLYLLFWCFISAVKTHTEVIRFPFALPDQWEFINFVKTFSLIEYQETTLIGMIFNSLYFSVLGSFLHIMCTCMIAYVATKYKFPGSQLLFYFALVMVLLPIYGSGGSQYKLMYKLGFIDSPLMILTSLSGLGMFFMYFNAFFKNLSWTYAESAQIDGANDFVIFFKIMLPQTVTLFGALFLMSWMAEWNNYGTAIIYLTKMPTLAAGIYLFKVQMQYRAQMNYYYAACFISLIPTLTIFMFFSKTLMNNVSLGGIKG